MKSLGYEFLCQVDREALFKRLEFVEEWRRKPKRKESSCAGDLLKDCADFDKAKRHFRLIAAVRLLFEIEDTVEQLPVHVYIRVALAVPECVFAVETTTAKDLYVTAKALVVSCAGRADAAALQEVVERAELSNVELQEVIQDKLGGLAAKAVSSAGVDFPFTGDQRTIFAGDVVFVSDGILQGAIWVFVEVEERELCQVEIVSASRSSPDFIRSFWDRGR